MAKMLVAPIEALTDPRLSFQERAVLLALYSFKGKTDTVYPGLDAIAKRANISDTTRISKLTKNLAEKGWLTKKKRGFTGCNSYFLTVPNLVKNANMGESANLVSGAKSNLAKNAKSNLVKNAKYKEQTIEQTIEQTSVGDEPPPHPPDEKFEMYSEWQPDSNFGDHLKRSSIDLEKIPIERVNEIQGEFVDYWMTRMNNWGKSKHTHSEWQHKLLSNYINQKSKRDLYKNEPIRKTNIVEKLNDRSWAT